MNQSKPKSPPARSPLMLMNSNIWVKDEFNSHGVAKPIALNVREDYGNYFIACAHLLPEMVTYIDHLQRCNVRKGSRVREDGDCTCGFESLLSRAKEALGRKA